MNFVNNSPQHAVFVNAQCHRSDGCKAYLNGGLLFEGEIHDQAAQTNGSGIVPPGSSFTIQGYHSCTYTALANNVTAQSMGFRYFTFDGWEWTSGPTTYYCRTGNIQQGLARYVRHYNYGPSEIGVIQQRTVDNACNNTDDGSGSGA